MKTAFDNNVSRARPRVRLTGASNPDISIEAIAQAIAEEPAPSLAGAVKERAQALAEPRPTAAEAVQAALTRVEAPAPVKAHAEAPPAVVEVQTQPSPPIVEEQPETRRE